MISLRESVRGFLVGIAFVIFLLSGLSMAYYYSPLGSIDLGPFGIASATPAMFILQIIALLGVVVVMGVVGSLLEVIKK